VFIVLVPIALAIPDGRPADIEAMELAERGRFTAKMSGGSNVTEALRGLSCDGEGGCNAHNEAAVELETPPAAPAIPEPTAEELLPGMVSDGSPPPGPNGANVGGIGPGEVGCPVPDAAEARLMGLGRPRHSVAEAETERSRGCGTGMRNTSFFAGAESGTARLNELNAAPGPDPPPDAAAAAARACRSRFVVVVPAVAEGMDDVDEADDDEEGIPPVV
jgi:hypothetical protein